jgi:hypothetical protein
MVCLPFFDFHTVTNVTTSFSLQDSEPITALAVSPDCRSLVAASRSLAVKHWDWASGECKRTWKVRRQQQQQQRHQQQKQRL